MKNKIKNSELVQLFTDGKNCGEIAKLFNCNPETIRLRLKKEGINTSKKICDIKCVHCNGNSRKEGKTAYGKQRYFCLECDKLFVEDMKEQNKIMLARHEEIKKMYLEDSLSTLEIGKKLGVSSTVPQRILKKYGITRSVLNSFKIRYKKTYGIEYDEYVKTLPAYLKFKKEVYFLTKKNDLKRLPNFEYRGLCGVKGAYQLDHMYSILEGFKNGVESKIIANINNLEFIPWEENLKKRDKCSITLNKLMLQI